MMVKGMATCKVCGRDFALIAEEHYIAKDPVKGGFAAVVGEAVYQYDAFNCPHCGCQYIAQPRKASAELDDIVVVGEDEDEAEEHDGCERCKHAGMLDDCESCKRFYEDNYEREDEE